MPIKSFPGQNHDAHMQTKAAWLEDPMNGQTPIMANVGPILQANIREHMVMKYQEQIAGAMQAQGQQVTGAATDQKTMEMVIGQAAQMVAENNKAAQALNAQGSPDQQIAQAEMLKAKTGAAELDHKRKKDFADAAIEAEKVNLEAIKEANRHAEAKGELMAGINADSIKHGKDLTIAAVKALADGEKHAATLESNEKIAKQKATAKPSKPKAK